MEAAYRDMVMSQTHPVVLMHAERRRRLLRWNHDTNYCRQPQPL